MFQITKAPGPVEAVSHAEGRDLAGRATNRSSAHIWRAFQLEGHIDLERLQNAADALCMHHEALRTRFERLPDGSFARRISDTPELRVIHEDWPHCRANDPAVFERLGKALDEGLGIGDCPMAKLIVLSLAEQRSVLAFIMADTITDASAIRIALQDLTAHYCGREVTAPIFQLSDYVHSHNAWLASQDYRDQLGRAVDSMQRRIDARGLEAVLRYPGGERDAFTLSTWFGKPLGDALHAVCEEMRIGITTLLAAACAMASAIARDAGETFFTTAFSNRNPRGANRIIGRLSTTLPNFVERIPGESLRDCAARMHRDIFYASAVGGPIPIQDFVDEIERRNPDVPAGAQIRFGHTLIDAMIVDEYDVLGLPTRAISYEQTRPTTNDFKFVCRYMPERGISISLRGRRFRDNEARAQLVLTHLDQILRETAGNSKEPA